MDLNVVELTLLLVAGHFFADYVFQSDYMARGKNRNRPPENVPPGQRVMTVWPYILTAHAGVHGTIVGLITGVWWLGLAEAVCHWLIDFGKCENWYGIHFDQGMHFFLKLVWVELALRYGGIA